MKMTQQNFSDAHIASVSGGADEIAVLFSQIPLDDQEIGGKRLTDLEAGICENSAPQTSHSRRAGHVERASSMGNSRICG